MNIIVRRQDSVALAKCKEFLGYVEDTEYGILIPWMESRHCSHALVHYIYKHTMPSGTLKKILHSTSVTTTNHNHLDYGRSMSVRGRICVRVQVRVFKTVTGEMQGWCRERFSLELARRLLS